MPNKKIDKKTSELTIDIVADKKEWKSEQEKAFQEIAKTTNIKGFRKGKAPVEILRKNISQSEIFSKAITSILNSLSQKAAKEIEEDLIILDGPTYSIEKISDAELEVKFIYPVYPEFELPDYKKLGVKFNKNEVSKKQIDTEIEKIRSSRATLETKDGAIEKGDTAIFDFKGMVNGKEFEGGAAEKYPLEIGSGQFIPGFEEQMIGMKVGEEREIKVTFPEAYQSKDLKGKDALFIVKLHEIKNKKLPIMNDEFVESLGIKDVKTIKELNDYMTKIMKEQEEQKARQIFQKEAFTKILEKVDIPLPAQLVVKEMKRQEGEFNSALKEHGQTMEQYIKMTGLTLEALNSQFKKDAESKLKEYLVFAEIAMKEEIELSEKEYDEEYKKLAKVYGHTEESIKNVITKEQMQVPMTNDRVITKLIEYNNK